MTLKEYPPAPEWGPDIMASIRFGNACREIDRENADAIRAELERARQSEKEGWRYARELEDTLMRAADVARESCEGWREPLMQEGARIAADAVLALIGPPNEK